MAENNLPTNLAKQEIGKSKVSAILPILEHIGAEWGLNISRLCDFKTAKRILINSVKNN